MSERRRSLLNGNYTLLRLRKVNEVVVEEIDGIHSVNWASKAVSSVSVLLALLLGVFNTLQALEVHFRGRALLVERYIAFTSDNVARLALFLFGVFMFLLARHLWLRKRAALFLLFGLFFGRAVTGILLGGNFSIAVTYFILSAVLLLAVGEFDVMSDPASLKRFLIVLPVVLITYLAVATVGLYLLRGKLDMAVSPLNLFYSTLLLAVGEHGAANFHGWQALFADLLTLTSILALFYLASLLLRPWEEECRQSPEEHQRARRLVERYGSDSLAYFTIREDKNLFFHGPDTFLAYRCLEGVAVISGDPVGPPERVSEILDKFREYCRRRGLRLAVIGARRDNLPAYEELGLKAICIGEEAVIHLGDFSLEGRRVKTLRHAVSKLHRMGVTMEFQFNAGIPSHLRHELARLSSDWREGIPETGFSMGLGRLMHSEDENCLLAVAYDADSSPLGFLYLVPMYPDLGYSLDVARTAAGSPNGVNEFMIARTALFLKERGFSYMTLHLSGLSHFYRRDGEERGSVLGRAVVRIVSCLGIPTLSIYRFDRKFQPRWLQRYVIYQSYLDLPRVAWASMAAESVRQVSRRYRRRLGHLRPAFRNPN